MESVRTEAGVVQVDNPGAGEPADAWIREGLHDLCQPLTALECLLFVNREPVAHEPLEAALLRSVMDEALVECGRMMVLISGLQDRSAAKSVWPEVDGLDDTE